MWPGINLIHPATADSLLQYRVARIAGAQAKARSYSPPFSGACFPWESAFTGEETCPSWAATGLREIHINGDISIAVWNFWRQTMDNSGGWLNDTAWPVLSGIAQFWMSKLAIDNPSATGTSPLNVLNVIPPDEYVDHVNNSAFTNAGVYRSLQYAAAVAELLGMSPASYEPWLDSASRVVIPFNSSGGGWHPEYDTYQLGQKIKQADAILLGFPLSWPMTDTTRANDLRLYANVTDENGPAMTWGMFSIGYVELGAGYEALAASNFNRSFANAHLPYYVWTETPSGGCSNFMTGAGGFLQTALFGYTGMRVNDTGIKLNSPSLPEATSIVRVRGVSYLGARIDIEYNSSVLTVVRQAPAGAEPPLPITQYAPVCGGDDACARHLERARNQSLEMGPGTAAEGRAARTQIGRVALRGGSWIVNADTALVLVDAKGDILDLAPGISVALPRQSVYIRRKSTI